MEKAATNLAKKMSVTPQDVMSLARTVASMIVADGISGELMHRPVETVQAYVQAAIKNHNKFVSKYLTNNDARNALQKHLYALLTENIDK